jgi:outer membrane protein assembly factor BamB
MYQYDPQHTGYSPSQMPESLSLLWESKEFDSYISHVIVSEGRVIAVLGPKYVISLDITDGSLQWNVGGDFAAYPAADKGRIFVGVYDGILCLDSVTGNVLWNITCSPERNLMKLVFTTMAQGITILSWDAS